MNEDRIDPAFAEVLDDVVIAVDDDLRQHHAPWDLAAVISRAHQLDPHAVPLDWVREVEGDAPVISLAQERRARRITQQDPAFEELLVGVRASVEHDAAIRADAASANPAPANEVGAIAPPTRPLWRWMVAVAAVAAAGILAVGLVEGVAAIGSEPGVPAAAALLQGDAEHDGEMSAAVERPRETARVRRDAPTASDVPSEPAPLEAIATSGVRPEGVPTRALRTKTPKSKPSEPAAPSLAERLAALDGEANAALAAKDYTRAAALFEEVIARAGKASVADLAYGDLFNIAHMRGDKPGLLALWKRYLHAWPRGRFADDARAGICRRGGGDASTCWQDYLEDFPKGSYRKEAERALADTP